MKLDHLIHCEILSHKDQGHKQNKKCRCDNRADSMHGVLPFLAGFVALLKRQLLQNPFQ
jgi:hypothetical protein